VATKLTGRLLGGEAKVRMERQRRIEFAQFFREKTRVVFSRTLDRVADNTMEVTYA
jgi:hypothetical protein